MEQTKLLQILREQKEEIALKQKQELIPRENPGMINRTSNLAQIITGIRRCGKSTLAMMVLQGTKFAYVNFDDERFAELNSGDLNQILETLFVVYGEFEFMLLDEVQNVDGWHLFVNRLLRNNYKIVLTGSNSNLLSREMATHLTGRYTTIELLPFSFREYLLSKNIEIKPAETTKETGIALNYFLDYIKNGGFPEIVRGETSDPYIRNLFEAIVTRDIIYRYKIRNIRTFREIALWLTANYSSEISYNRIKNIFALGSENTVKNYVSYLEEAWLFITISKFSFKKQESLRNKKLYLSDTSFADLVGQSGSGNIGRLLENFVFLHLLRNRQLFGYEIFYYKTKLEVDFVIYLQRKVKELIQVAASVENKTTLSRETKALTAASKELNVGKLTIITLNQKDTITSGDLIIFIKPVLEWMAETIIFEESNI